MIYTKSEIEHIAAEMCQQDWSDLRFQDVYYRAFIEGASYFNSIPEGYALVPVDPTDAMTDEIRTDERFTNRAMRVRYQSMLNAVGAYEVADAQFQMGSVVDEEV